MKTAYRLFFLCFIAMLAMSSCRNDDISTDSFKIERERAFATADSVSITGSYSFAGLVKGMKVNIGEQESLIDALSYDLMLEGTDFSVSIGNLKPSTQYYYCYSVDFGTNDNLLTETKSFTTLDAITETPTVRTIEVLAIDSTTFRVKCEVLSDGGEEVTERGICYNTYGDPTMDDETIQYSNGGLGQYTLRMENLAMSKKYYVRAYAKNANGISLGEVLDFRTGSETMLPQVSTVEVSNVTYNTASCLGNVSSNGGLELRERGVCWGLEHDPTINVHHIVAEDTETGNFTVTIVGLAPNTSYYVRAYATNEKGTSYGEELTFMTTEGLPIVTTAGVTNITTSSALCGGNVTDEGASPVIERGVCWNTSHDPTISGNHITSGTGAGVYTASITGLTPNATYYVRAYAKNNQGTSYGAEVEFTAMEGLPVVQTIEVTDITAFAAKVKGRVNEQGGSTVTERGICWNTSPSPTFNDSHASNGTGLGEYNVNLNNLTPGTNYYVRAYAKNSQGIAYGEQKDFTTMATFPNVVIVGINGTTVSINVTDDGGATVTERGICWSISHNPTTSDHHISVGTGTGIFTIELTDLEPGTSYYVRAYAVNSVGTAYSNEMNFTTTANLPTVTTGEVSNITQNSAQGSGYVTDSGGATVTERGLCWSISHNPTVINSHANGGSGTGPFNCNMTGLTANTTYFVRAYAKNSAGIAYGEEVSFRTSQNNISAPTVTTAQVTNIQQNSATGGGNVTNDGGATVTERGICWSTSHNPTTSGNHISNGTGTGNFTCIMNGLTGGTTYFVRAYAINSQGTSYGNETSFTTPAGLPTVTTSQVTNITQTTATGGGNVTNNGGTAIIERGICWSTSHNPTTSGSHANNGTGTGSFSVGMTNLTANTIYYVRAYAINSAGIQYGNEVSFNTQQAANLPTVTTSQVINITQTSASSGGNVTEAGGSNVTERGICWSTSHNPTINDNSSSGGAGLGAYSVQMTDLTANTTYYVRAFATNSAGTAYGEEVPFTTLSNLPTVTTSPVTNITQTTATGGGDVTANGGANVTERGICWSTSHNPTTSNSHQSSGTGTGNYTVQMTGLTANTTYYVRAYAINSAGTQYGSEVTFVTLPNLPTVTTNPVTNITQNSATGGGNVTATGGANVTERGICWSTSHNPTIAGSHQSNGSGTGSYTVNMTNLSTNTPYYVRAYAINSGGTAYGEEVSFITLPNLPTVSSIQLSNITQTSATATANVTSGIDVTERGVCWSTSPNPTTSGNHTSNGSGLGSFSVNITSLSAGTTYYVRAYAINSAGTKYGAEASFTTIQPTPTGAINGMFSVSATEQVWFSQGNLQYKASSNTWRFATNQYDHIGEDNTNISQTYNGWIDLFGWGTSGWNSGNTYYHPWDTDISDGTLYGPPGNYPLTGEYANADWGVYNSITNGGNQPNSGWRTITYWEWNYVLNTRSTSSGIRYAKAIVNGTNGLILLPDNWNSSSYTLNSTNSATATFTSNVISYSNWTSALEANGAVFLPVSGVRNDTTIYVIEHGCYWTSTHSGYGDNDYASQYYFTDENIGFSSAKKYSGCAVRLVRPVQ